MRTSKNCLIRQFKKSYKTILRGLAENTKSEQKRMKKAGEMSCFFVVYTHIIR
ncbi:hypothetical protein HMPREF0653_01846 [Prevotella disiens JCM 6334 = ATCC 29426]|uniref:Uncharacterized protein n=1 Tax=Prevotella disiens JCM 6334 = ATCC 29426 TaxID=1235811 RepID=A0ABN0NQU8_9BACT|nr:hypothetical protein HMPREF0653_01846 [Prevotella disiens JCM 6334 = ATCC 29426]